MSETARDSEIERGGDAPAVPGVVVVWSGATPRLTALRVPPPGLVLGRDALPDDERLSRQHARIRWDGARFHVADLASRNGTFVNGRAVNDGDVAVVTPAVVRVGRTVCLLVDDLEPFVAATVATVDGAIVGPTLRRSWDAVERAARSGRALLLTGDSGVGKELAARAFHRASAIAGELCAVNCAAIPHGLAERLLFGARRGAYSGADKDSDGYLAAADGGTLFLDELGELDLAVQAKLLRVLETGELLALGAPRPRMVSLRVVAATLKDLRREVTAGRFRDDLYFRIGRPEVRIPALRDRREDLPWLCAAATRASGLPPHATLIEACLLRPWPGNVRELIGEVTRAAHAAVELGHGAVRAEDLDERAGRLLTDPSTPTAPSPITPFAVPIVPSASVPSDAARPAPLPDHRMILDALGDERGNVSAAARRLGVRRNQLRRYLARHPDAAALVTDAAADDSDDA